MPSSCKQDLLKYKASGLFDNSTGLADHYCANITLVLRDQVKEQRDNTKAGKYVQKQETKNKGARKKTTGTEHDMSTIEVKPVDSQTPDSQRSLYRMTLDFRLLNKVTLHAKYGGKLL